MNASEMMPWKCFECEKVVLVSVQVSPRDGSKWGQAPSGWLFVNDEERTHVCSAACLAAIYSRDD